MMTAHELCTRQVVCARKQTSLGDAARMMRERHVGSLVIVEDTEHGHAPLGLLTDRDIAVAVIAREVDPNFVTVADVMSADLVCVRGEASTLDALGLMRAHGVRRILVTDARGILVGILALDDVLQVIAEALSEISRVIASESAREARSRP